MSNIIDKIQLSGTNYDIQDSNAAKVVEITQENYDLLPTSAKTANIMYVITDATPIDVSQYWTSAQTQSAITEATSGKANSSDVYTKSETSGATELATAFAATQPKLSAGTNITIDANNVISAEGGGITSGEVQTMINDSISGKADTSSLATVATSGSYDDLTNKPTLFSGSYNDLTDKPTIPTVPTSNTAFTNDAQYATSAYVDTKLSISDFNTYSGTVNTAIGNKANSSDVYTKSETSGATQIATALSGKQDTLSAGTNITIDANNVISATGGGSITIDPTLDSGSTNAVANSAITNGFNSIILQRNNDGGNTRWFDFYVNGQNKGMIYNFSINGKRPLTKENQWSTDSNIFNFNLVETSAITTAITSSSTDAQVPSAKAVNDKLGGLSIVKLTQSAYDALSPDYDSNTLYVIVN